MKLKVIFCLLFMPCIILAEDGKLHRFEDKAKTSEAKPALLPPADSCEGRWQTHHPGEVMPAYYCQSGGEAAGSFFADLFFGPIVRLTLGAPFYLPAIAIDDRYDKTDTFSSYPFENESGYFSSRGKDWLIGASASHQWVSHGLYAWRGEVSAMTSSRLGMDVSYTRYREHVGDELNTLAILDIIPTFSFARSAKWDWRAGVGYEAIQGNEHYDRTKLVYKVRRFFDRPLRLDIDLGVALSSGKPIFEIAPGLAYHFKRFEIKATYRRVNVSDVVLEGPELGVSVWF